MVHLPSRWQPDNNMHSFLDPPIHALLFDMDGTLIDSKEDVYGALAHVLEQHGRGLTDEEFCSLIGKNWDDVHAYLDARRPMPMTVSVMQRKVYEERHRRVNTVGASMLPGVAHIVPRLSALLPCVVVTGSSREEAELLLQSTGLMTHFRFLVCAGDAARGKPAPDPYLLAAEQLDLDPAHCLAIEDSSIGISSARSAGMRCVGVEVGNFTKQDQSEATHVLYDFFHLEQALLSALRSAGSAG